MKASNHNYPQLSKDFEDKTLNPEQFRHVDHVGVAYVMLQKYEFLEALYRYSNSIREIATKHGAPEKFNLTITVAFLSLIAERMMITTHTDANDFITKNSDLLEAGILNQWYSKERLSGLKARSTFLMPMKIQTNQVKNERSCN